MAQIKAIAQEISQAINARVGRGEIINLTLFTLDFVRSKNVYGDDVEFFRVCTRDKVQEVAASCIKKFNTKKPKADEILLPGFERLQLAYPIMRNGDQKLVPIELMTDEELIGRAEEYETGAKGLNAHAGEIRAYIYARNAMNDNIAPAKSEAA